MTAWMTYIPAFAALLTSIGALFAVVSKMHQDRKKPALDESNSEVARETVRKMINANNYYRDVRMWQLEGYVDLDREWHRSVITQFRSLLDLLRELRDNGTLPAHIPIPDAPPPPPVVPEPPPRG